MILLGAAYIRVPTTNSRLKRSGAVHPENAREANSGEAKTEESWTDSREGLTRDWLPAYTELTLNLCHGTNHQALPLMLERERSGMARSRPWVNGAADPLSCMFDSPRVEKVVKTTQQMAL